MPKAASDYVFFSALEVARAIKRSEVTSLELTTQVLDRIEKYNPALNAIVTLLKDEAINCAQAADKAFRKGELWGSLHGVPCSVKDTFEMANVLTTSGSLDLSKHIPKKDAEMVKKLRAAGPVLLGHTNVPLFAGDWQSYNEIFGATNNPWDRNRTPGGSSGGSAAMLAAGLSYLSFGSDIGGSIRIPAHFCGVYGHKPSLNLVSMHGHIPPPPGVKLPPGDLAVAGPLARSAADLKLALNIIGGPDSIDSIAYSWTLPPARGSCLKDYRIGYILDDPLCPVTSDVKKVLTQAVEALQKAGVVLEEGWPKGVKPMIQYDTYLSLLYSTYAHQLQDDKIDEVRKQAMNKDNFFGSRLAEAWIAPHKYYQRAHMMQIRARTIWQRFFSTHDAFLLPTAFISAFPHDHSEPIINRCLTTSEGRRSYNDLLFWISFATLTGLPATTAPVGLTNGGLPVGIQIIGPYLEDATPIDLAGEITDIIGGFQPPTDYKV
ncbi:MAG: amidase [Promethearchaeota archaeon]